MFSTESELNSSSDLREQRVRTRRLHQSGERKEERFRAM